MQAKYREEVNPDTKVFFVSFFQDTTTYGQMVKDLDNRQMGDCYQQFRFEMTRPDLSKVRLR